MNIRRTISVIIIIFIISFSLPQSVFSDNTVVINTENAERLLSIGLFKGSTNGFELQRRPTRIEAAVMLVRMLGKEKEAQAIDRTHPFSDVPSWANNYAGYLYENNLTKGVSANLFGSDQYLFINQYVTFILRALGYSDTNGDFEYNECLKKAEEIGLLNNNELEYYIKKSEFLRDDIVGITINALLTNMKSSNRSLLDKLVYEDMVIDEQTAIDAGFIQKVDKPLAIKDPNLEAVIRDTIGKRDGALYVSDIENVIELRAEKKEITSLEGLQDFKSLKALFLDCNKISDLKPIEGIEYLTTLFIGKNEVDNIDALSKISSLRDLNLLENRITNIKPLEPLTGIEFLCLGNNQITDIGPLANLTNLKTLMLLDLNISDIKPLEKLTKVTDLDLRINNISDISPLTSMINLKYLKLTFNKVSDISKLSSLKNLNELDLLGNLVSDISSLSGLVNLTKLDLARNSISNVTPLAGLKNLKELYLSENPISDYTPIKDLYNQLVKKDFTFN